MTKEEFLDFDAVSFYRPEFAKECAYMQILTFYVVASANEAISTTKALKNDWFGPNSAYPDLKTYLEEQGIVDRFTWNPEHKKEVEFLKQYESLCKKFLNAYDNNIKEIKTNSSNYHTATRVECFLNRLPSNKKPKLTYFRDSSFIDFREPFSLSLTENGALRSNTVEDYAAQSKNQNALAKFNISLERAVEGIRAAIKKDAEKTPYEK